MLCVRVNFQPFEGSRPIKYGFAGKRGSRKAGVAYANGQQSDNRSNAGFLDPLLGKAATRPGSSIEARSMSHGAAEPAPLGSTLSELEKSFSSRGMQVLLNVGFLGAGFAILSSLALESTTDPWHAYQKAVTFHPIETKACISGIVYSLGDLIAQTYEGRDISEWDRMRIVRSGLCGLLAHGPLSHLYYVALDHAFAQTSIPTGSWLVPLGKVVVDQTVWSLFWNSTYYVLLGLLKFESPLVIAATVRSTWWDLLKAGWRLWPLVHLLTYGIIPVQHRLLFVDAVELVWVTILSLYGQQQRRSRDHQGTPQWVACPLPGGDGEGGDAAEEILRGLSVESEIVFESSDGERKVFTPDEVFGYDGAAAQPDENIRTM